MQGMPSVLSIGSRNSVLSVGSCESVLSIGSHGSALSIGSVASFASIGSLGSAMSLLSVASFQARGSLLSGQSDGAVLAWRRSVHGRTVTLALACLAATAGAAAVWRFAAPAGSR